MFVCHLFHMQVPASYWWPCTLTCEKLGLIFFGLHHTVCGKPHTLHWKCGVLTTGSPGKSLHFFLNLKLLQTRKQQKQESAGDPCQFVLHSKEIDLKPLFYFFSAGPAFRGIFMQSMRSSDRGKWFTSQAADILTSSLSHLISAQKGMLLSSE